MLLSGRACVGSKKGTSTASVSESAYHGSTWLPARKTTGHDVPQLPPFAATLDGPCRCPITSARCAKGRDHAARSAHGERVVFDARGASCSCAHVEGDEWTTPGGMIEPEETPADAAVREAWEETGLVVALTRIVGVFGGSALHQHLLERRSHRVGFDGVRGAGDRRRAAPGSEETLEARLPVRRRDAPLATQGACRHVRRRGVASAARRPSSSRRRGSRRGSRTERASPMNRTRIRSALAATPAARALRVRPIRRRR